MALSWRGLMGYRYSKPNTGGRSDHAWLLPHVSTPNPCAITRLERVPHAQDTDNARLLEVLMTIELAPTTCISCVPRSACITKET